MHESTYETSECMSQRKPAPTSGPDEVLVADPRAGLTPAQQVEHKLLNMLRTSPLLVSRLQSVRPTRR